MRVKQNVPDETKFGKWAQKIVKALMTNFNTYIISKWNFQFDAYLQTTTADWEYIYMRNLISIDTH